MCQTVFTAYMHTLKQNEKKSSGYGVKGGRGAQRDWIVIIFLRIIAWIILFISKQEEDHCMTKTQPYKSTYIHFIVFFYAFQGVNQ